MLLFEKVDKGQEYNIRNDAIRWQMLKSINVTSCSFALASPFSRYLQLKFYLEKVGQGQR